MQRLTSTRFAQGVVLTGTCVLIAAGAMTQLIACDESSAARDPEDKTGVHDVPSPTRSSGVGQNGAGGGGGGDGSGGGTTTGAPCNNQPDCEDDDICTIDTCDAGKCTQNDAANDGNPCTMDSCDMTGLIKNTPIVPTDDMNACTFDVCDPATGAVSPTALTIFSDDFSSNAKGWILGAEWQIGTANASIGGLNGGNDPDMDFSMSDDNGVAGTVLGGLVSNTTHGPQYLTSPAISLATFNPGSEFLTLRFRRWLTTDAPGTMPVTVELLDGAGMATQLWTNQGAIFDSPPDGTGWFEFRLDITTLATAAKTTGAMRIRFGFSRNMSGGASVGGWNIDDFSIERWAQAADLDACTTDDCAPTGTERTHTQISPCPL